MTIKVCGLGNAVRRRHSVHSVCLVPATTLSGCVYLKSGTAKHLLIPHIDDYHSRSWARADLGLCDTILEPHSVLSRSSNVGGVYSIVLVHATCWRSLRLHESGEIENAQLFMVLHVLPTSRSRSAWTGHSSGVFIFTSRAPGALGAGHCAMLLEWVWLDLERAAALLCQRPRTCALVRFICPVCARWQINQEL